MKTFYKELKKQGKDVKWLATQLGVSHQTVYHWKLGKTKPKLSHIRKISVILRIEMETLFSDHY